MSKTVRKIIGTAAPLAGLIPGVGLPLAVALGAGGGLLSGGGLKGALAGGLGGALTGGGAGLLGDTVSSGLGLGLDAGGAAASGIGGGLLGAGAGAASGGLSGALLGGVLGGGGSFLSNGGLSELGSATGLGTTAGSPLENGIGPTQGSGILGSATRGLSDIGSALSTGVGGGGSSYGGGSTLGLGAALLGGANSLNANDKAQKELLAANSNALSQLAPYTASGASADSRLSDLLGTSGNSSASDYGSLAQPFTPGDLTQTPGYQFQLQQGNAALDRQQAAKGNYFSGSALKAAQDYGTGLADQTYNTALNQYQQQQQQQYGMLAGQAGAGQGAATTAGNIDASTGNAQAGSTISSSNILNSTLSSLLSGSGAKRPVNIGGQVVYV